MTTVNQRIAALQAELTPRQYATLRNRLAREAKAQRRAHRAPMEAARYLAQLRDLMERSGRKVAEADPEDLTHLLALQAVLDQAITVAVRGQRARWQRSWADIGRGANITRQAAQQRWGGSS